MDIDKLAEKLYMVEYNKNKKIFYSACFIIIAFVISSLIICG